MDYLCDEKVVVQCGCDLPATISGLRSSSLFDPPRKMAVAAAVALWVAVIVFFLLTSDTLLNIHETFTYL